MKILLASLVFVSGVAVSAQHLMPGAPGLNPGHPNYGSHGPGHPNYRPPGHGHPGHGRPGHRPPGHRPPGHGHPGYGHPHPGHPYPTPYPGHPPHHPPYRPPQNPPYRPPHNPPHHPPYGNQCSRDLCVGHQVVAVDSGKTVTIQAVDYNGRYIVRDMYGYTYPNIDRTNLAVMYGSSQGLYVGQQVTALDSGKRVTIVAIQLNGRFVVRDLYGYTYTNIDRYNLTNY